MSAADDLRNDELNSRSASKRKEEPVYVKVVDEENEEPVEIPTEKDGLLLLATLAAQFPGASGLKFKSDSGAFRGLRVDEAGKIHPPPDSDHFGSRTYLAVFPKENIKRKMDDHVDASGATKLKRVERKKCSDLIVLGLPFKTTEEELREYFEQFGELLVTQIKRDMKTGNSKGFGFIRFAEYESQLKAMSQRHNIDGRMCDVRIPNSKLDSSNPTSHKVFVGRMTEDIETDDLRSHFSQYGRVTDVFVPKPFRSFAFVTFEDASVAESLCGEEFVIKGCSVQVSPATPKDSGHGAVSRQFYGAGSGRRGGGGYIAPFEDNRFGRAPVVEPFLRPYDPMSTAPQPNEFYPDARPAATYYGGNVSEYDQRAPYSGYKSMSRGSAGERGSPLSKISRPQVWSSSSTAGGYGLDAPLYGSNGSGRAAAASYAAAGGGGYMSPWESSTLPASRRSDTPSFVAADACVNATKMTSNPVSQQSSSATSQATAGISALNLNSLINPAVLAAAQACLLNQLAASGSTDFSALLSNLQAAAAQNAPQGGPKAGQPPDSMGGGFDGRSRLDE